MKVYLSNYRDHWISPYTIIEYAFFWTAWSKCGRRKGYMSDSDYIPHPAWVDKLADKLIWISNGIHWVLDRIHPKITYVKVDRWDTWSADYSLAHIILPTLEMLKEVKNGAPPVDDEDVPEYLRSYMAQPKEYEWDADELYFKRWDWVLDEMIFAFEHKVDDTWEDRFHSGEFAKDKMPGEEGWQGTHTYDWEGAKLVHDRMQNGFKLFGKYYQGLWW